MRFLTALLVLLVAMAVPAWPAAALEIQGEHRIMVTQKTDGPEAQVAEALVIRHKDRWLELVITQAWSQVRPPRLDAEMSLWRTVRGWDWGLGVVWRLNEHRLEPWIMVAKPW